MSLEQNDFPKLGMGDQDKIMRSWLSVVVAWGRVIWIFSDEEKLKNTLPVAIAEDVLKAYSMHHHHHGNGWAQWIPEAIEKMTACEDRFRELTGVEFSRVSGIRAKLKWIIDTHVQLPGRTIEEIKPLEDAVREFGSDIKIL